MAPTIYGPDSKRGGYGARPDGILKLGGNSELKTYARQDPFLRCSPYSRRSGRTEIRARLFAHTAGARCASVAIDDILAHEDRWPERVLRAPLTEEDRAMGYTGGLIEMIDIRDSNDGSLEMDAFDLRTEWPLAFLDGRLRLYADATYHKSNVRK